MIQGSRAQSQGCLAVGPVPHAVRWQKPDLAPNPGDLLCNRPHAMQPHRTHCNHSLAGFLADPGEEVVDSGHPPQSLYPPLSAPPHACGQPSAVMRFLCLHGKGTNSQILEIQTAAIRHQLGSHYVFEFLDACFECAPAPGTELFASQNDSFLSWIDEESPERTLEALNDFEAYIQEAGPFDGVIAFSQAAGFVASYMIRQLRNADPMHALLSPPFKCAVFLCSAPATKGGEFAKYLDPVLDKHRIRIPTAHIWGRNDRQVENSGSWLVELCAVEMSETFVHEGGHEVPGTRAPDSLRSAVRAIQKTIDRVAFSY